MYEKLMKKFIHHAGSIESLQSQAVGMQRQICRPT